MHNCVSCHLPNVDGQIDPSLMVVPIGLHCVLCGQFVGVASMLMCDWWSKGWYMGCLTLHLDKVLVGKWFGLWCTS